MVAGCHVTHQALAHRVVRRCVGGPLQRLLGLFQPSLRLMHRGQEIIGGQEIGRFLRHLLRQLLGLVECPAVTQCHGQAHPGPGHHPPLEHPSEHRFRLGCATQLMQQLALEAQRIVHVGRLLLDHPVAGGNRLVQGAPLDLLVDMAQHMLLVDHPDQAALQLLGGKRLDQVVVRRQLGQRHDVGVAAFAGDDHVHRGERDQVGMAQLFQQLLAVAPIIKHEIGQDDVETVALDLADHLGRIACAMHRRHPQCPEHQAQGITGRWMSVDDQDALLGQGLLQNEQHLVVVERTGGLGWGRIHRRKLTALRPGRQESGRVRAETFEFSAT